MNKLIQASLIAVVFGVSSTAIYAAPKKESKQCGGAPCEGEIDIELEILKACELKVGKDIKLVEESYTGSSVSLW